jgi:hypothetical protein
MPLDIIKDLLLLFDNAPVHWTLALEKKLAYLSYPCLDYSHYSMDMVPPDDKLFSGLKKIERSQFSFDAEVIAATQTQLGRPKSDFL